MARRISCLSVCIYAVGLHTAHGEQRFCANVLQRSIKSLTGKEKAAAIWRSTCDCSSPLYRTFNPLWMRLVMFSGQCSCWIQPWISTPGNSAGDLWSMGFVSSTSNGINPNNRRSSLELMEEGTSVVLVTVATAVPEEMEWLVHMHTYNMLWM